MNDSSLYVVGIVLNGTCILILILFLCLGYNEFKYKQRTFIQASVPILLGVVGIISCNIKRIDTYKEVYYLRYTIYYPGSTCTYEVDSCNHVYTNSDRGTNYLRYYSIPDKETYGIYTSAPIVINKITKK